MAVLVCPICGERATWRGQHGLLPDPSGGMLDCPSRHAATTPVEAWNIAFAARLEAEIDAFVNPSDDIGDHDHRWEPSEAADELRMWECLDCSAWAVAAGPP